MSQTKAELLDGKSATVNLKNPATADNSTMNLVLQTGETDIAANDVIGKISFQAPDEGTGTDAILVAAGIQATSEGDFSSSANATKLEFLTAASEAASSKMRLSSAGNLEVDGGIDIEGGDVDLRVESNGNTHMLFVDGGNDKVGIGASSLSGTLHVKNADNTSNLHLECTDADANSGPLLTFDRNSSSPADSDVLTVIDIKGRNDAGEAVVYAEEYWQIEDMTDGTEDAQYIQTIIRGGTNRNRMGHYTSATVFNDDSQAIDFRVESDGNANMFQVDGTNNCVGVGAVNTSRTFNVTTPSSYAQYVASFVNASSSAPYGLFVNYSGAAPDAGNDYQFFLCSDTGATRFIIYGDGDTYNHDNAFNQISDQRIKQNITDANSQWDDIKALKVRNFVLKDDARADGDKAKVQIGVVAQEAESVCPKLVTSVNPSPEHILSSSEFGTLYEDGDTIPDGKEIGDVKEIKEQVKGFRYSVLYMKAIKALQEAMTKIEALETSNTDLKNRVTALEG